LRSIIALAHELGKKVVAEGVEVEDDVGFLRSIGCEYGQGYYYGEPMAERDVVQLLKVVRRAERRLKKSVLFRQRTKPRSDPAERPSNAQPMGNGGPPQPTALQLGDSSGAAKPPHPRSATPPRPMAPSNGSKPPRQPPPLPGRGAMPPAAPPSVKFEPSPLQGADATTAPADVPVRRQPPPAPGAGVPAEPPRLRTAPPNGMRPAADGLKTAPPPLPLRARTAATEASVPGPPMPPQVARPPAPRTPGPDLSKLPPAIRASLAKLAGEVVEEDGPKGPPSVPPA
jgi:hypothetical protein